MPHRDADKQLLQVPLGRGLDEGNAAFGGELGKPTTLENARILKNGSIEVRRGFEGLVNTVTPAAASVTAVDCFSHGEQLLALEDRYLCEWSESLNRWIRTDMVPEAQIQSVEIGQRGVANMTYVQPPDCDAVNVGNYRVVAWHYIDTSVHACAQVIDTASGARGHLSSWTAFSDCIRLVVVANRIYCCYRSAEQTVVARILDCTSAATVMTGWSAAVTLCNNLAIAHPQWECNSASTWFMMAYTKESAGPVYNCVMRRFPADLSVYVDATFASYAYHAYAINGYAGATDVCICAYDNAAAATGIVVSAATLSTMAGLYGGTVIDAVTTIYNPAGGASRLERIGIAMHGNASCRVVYSVAAAGWAGSPEPAVIHREVTVATGAITYTGILYNFTLAGQPFSVGAGEWVYAPVLVASKPWHEYTYSVTETKTVITRKLPRLQSSLFLVELPVLASTEGGFTPTRNNRAVIRLCPYLSGDLNTGTFPEMRPPNSFSSDGYTFLLASPKQGDGDLYVNTGFDVYKFSFSYDIAYRKPCRFGPVTMLSGGVPTQWDGNQTVEIGYNYYPRLGALTPSVVGGAHLTLLGTYSYRAVYTWMDSTGQWHSSTPSVAQTITLAGGNDTVTVYVDNLTLTDKADPSRSQCPVIIELYRTLMYTVGGVSTPGTEYYLVQRRANDPTAASQAIVDGLPDTAAAGAGADDNKLLYTSGGVVPGGCPGAVRQFITHDGRPWAILAGDPTQIAFGHVALPEEPPRFPDGWTLRCARGRSYTALATAGDKLIAFQEHAIDAIFGSGPGDNGSGGNYGDPQLVAENVGCSDPRGLVRYPGGYLFRAHTGLWSVSEGLETKYVGMAVQDTLATYPTVRGAVLDDSENRVVLFLSNSGGTLGTLLTWYYPWDAWSTWPVLDLTGAKTPALGGCVWDRAGVRRIAIAGATGYVFVERSTSLYQDPNATWLTMKATFGWMSLAGAQGFAHGWQFGVLGYYKQPTSIIATLCYDYNTSATEIHTWTTSDIAALLQGSRVQIAVQPARTESQAIQLTLALTTSGGVTGNTGALTRLEALTIEHAPDAGLVTLAAGARK